MATDLVRLGEAHRLAQARLGAETVRSLAAVWPLLDPSALDETFPLWMRALSPVVASARSRSARLAGNYMSMTRSLAGAPGAPVVVLAEQVPAEQLLTSMMVTGPTSIRKAAGSGVLLNRAVDVAQARAAAAAMRHVLNGGRATITDSVVRDRTAVGWARATSGAACAFCRMLASRGPVYKSQGSAQFQAHDGCACGAVPVWSRKDPWPAGAAQNKRTWDETTQGLHGKDAVNAFRRAVEGR